MPILFAYFVFLYIAPQLWVEPFVGTEPDLLVYGLWTAVVLFGRRRLLPLTVQDRFFLLMLAWILLSAAANGFRPHTGEILVYYLKCFLVYKLVAATTDTAARLRTVVKMIVFFSVVLAIEGIWHFHNPAGIGWAGQKLGWIDPEAAKYVAGRIRWINIFDGPGVFAVVFTTVLPFLLQYVWGPFGLATRITGVVLLAPVALALYHTGSRGGLLASLAVVGLFTAVRLGVSTLRILAASAVMVVLFTAAPTHMTTMNDQQHSASHRVDMWGEGVEMVQQNPVFGIGKGNFHSYTGRLIAHNSAIEIMGETGLPGLFFWLGIIYMGMKGVWTFQRTAADPVDSSYALALGLSVVGYLVSAMFVTLEYETFYILLGLCAVPGRGMDPPPSFGRRDLAFLGAATVGFAILIKGFVMAFY